MFLLRSSSVEFLFGPISFSLVPSALEMTVLYLSSSDGFLAPLENQASGNFRTLRLEVSLSLNFGVRDLLPTFLDHSSSEHDCL